MALEAGNIVFKLLADDKQLRGTLANTSRAIGAGMTAAGAAVTAFATSSVLDFARAGDEIGKMATRTGMSAEQLSMLKHAAEQGGTSLDNVEKASRNFSRVLTEARGGLTSATDALAYLGLGVEDYAGKNPDQIFMMTAEALANIEDPTLRSALAMEVWGARAGTQLIPMLEGGAAGFRGMMEEAQRLGLIFDDDMTASSQGITDEMDEVRKSIIGLKFDIAVALLPTIRDMLVWFRDTVTGIQAWVEANPELAASIVKITTVIGGIMTVVGPLLIALPGLATAWTAVSASVTAVVTVLGAVAAAIGAPVAVVVAAIAAIVAAAVALVYYWDEVKYALQAAWNFISNAWWAVWGPIIEKIQWLMNIGLGVLDRVGGFFGASGNSGINQDALARYNASQQNTGAGVLGAGIAAGAGGGQMMGNGVHIGAVNVYSPDPNQASRDLAQNLYFAMQAAGVTV